MSLSVYTPRGNYLSHYVLWDVWTTNYTGTLTTVHCCPPNDFQGDCTGWSVMHPSETKNQMNKKRVPQGTTYTHIISIGCYACQHFGPGYECDGIESDHDCPGMIPQPSPNPDQECCH